MSTHVSLRKYEVEDLIGFDHGDSAVTMTIFNGRVASGAPGWTQIAQMTPDQAEQVAAELIRRAKQVRGDSTNGPRGIPSLQAWDTMRRAIEIIRTDVNCRIEHGATGVEHLECVQQRLDELLKAMP